MRRFHLANLQIHCFHCNQVHLHLKKLHSTHHNLYPSCTWKRQVAKWSTKSNQVKMIGKFPKSLDKYSQSQRTYLLAIQSHPPFLSPNHLHPQLLIYLSIRPHVWLYLAKDFWKFPIIFTWLDSMLHLATCFFQVQLGYKLWCVEWSFFQVQMYLIAMKAMNLQVSQVKSPDFFRKKISLG